MNSKKMSQPFVFSYEITKKLVEQLGENTIIHNVKFIRTIDILNCKKYLYSINDKWLITILSDANGDTLEIEDYITAKKAFARKINRLCKKADVPWEIASLVGYISDENLALDILENIKEFRIINDETLIKNLTNSNTRRETLKQILGPSLWSKLDCNNFKLTYKLALYLIG